MDPRAQASEHAAKSKAAWDAGAHHTAWLEMKAAQEHIADGKVEQQGNGTLVVNRPGAAPEAL